MDSAEKGAPTLAELNAERLQNAELEVFVLILGGYFEQSIRLPAELNMFIAKAGELINELPDNEFIFFKRRGFVRGFEQHIGHQFEKTTRALTNMGLLEDSYNGNFVSNRLEFWETVRKFEADTKDGGDEEMKVYNLVADQLAQEFYDEDEQTLICLPRTNEQAFAFPFSLPKPKK